MQHEHGTAKPESKRFFSKKNYGYNKILLLSMVATLAMAPLVGWVFLGQEPVGAPIVQADTFDPRYSSTIKGPVTDPLEDRISSLTGNMEMLSSLITDLESKLATTDTLEARVLNLNENLEILDNLTSDIESRQMATDTLEVRISGLTASVDTLDKLTTNLESRQEAADKLEERVSNITRDLQILSDMASGLESMQIAALDTPVGVVPTKQESVIKPKPVTRQSSNHASQNRPWAINLISSPDRAYAARFSKSAQSKGVRTELQEITINGTQYWRVQVTDFSTHSEAKTYTNIVTRKLGLKDTWIMKR